MYFLFKLISVAYDCTFISVNQIILNNEFSKQSGTKKYAVILIKSCFFFFFFCYFLEKA